MNGGIPAHLSVLCLMFTITPIMINGQVEEDPLHNLHVRQISLLWILTCGDTEISLSMQLLKIKGHFTISLWMPVYQQLPRHLWMNVAEHEETCRGLR
jgi:hypothetical protein